MEYTNQYEPRIIIDDGYYDSYLLQLHREIVANKIAEDQDPPNPFRKEIVEDNVKIVVNNTNDLHYALKYFEKRIDREEHKYVIVGDPNSVGYKYESLQRMCEDIKYYTTLIKTKDWIICTININDNNKLIIENNKLVVI
jgi:hypothetical protein